MGYVLIDHRRVIPQVTTLATEAFDLEPIAVDGAVTLYRPRASALR